MILFSLLYGLISYTFSYFTASGWPMWRTR